MLWHRAINTLTQVLIDVQDLDQYVQALDRESAETGRDRPVVRKSLGMVYADRRQWVQAITQLKIAVQLQPNDEKQTPS